MLSFFTNKQPQGMIDCDETKSQPINRWQMGKGFRQEASLELSSSRIQRKSDTVWTLAHPWNNCL